MRFDTRCDLSGITEIKPKMVKMAPEFLEQVYDFVVFGQQILASATRILTFRRGVTFLGL